MTTATDITIPQTATGGNFIELDPGTYDAVVASIEQVPNPFEEDKTQLQFEFEITGYQNEDGTPATKRAWANPVWNGQSKLWKWSKAILGVTPAEGDPFRSSSLVGQPCRVFINSGENQKGEPVTKIVDVLGPAAKAAPKKAGLVTRLRAEQPENVNQDMGPCISCGGVADQFTGKGKPICADCK